MIEKEKFQNYLKKQTFKINEYNRQLSNITNSQIAQFDQEIKDVKENPFFDLFSEEKEHFVFMIGFSIKNVLELHSRIEETLNEVKRGKKSKFSTLDC